MLLWLEAENIVNTHRFCIDSLPIVFAHHNTVLKLQNEFQFRGSVSCRCICSSYYYLLYTTYCYLLLRRRLLLLRLLLLQVFVLHRIALNIVIMALNKLLLHYIGLSNMVVSSQPQSHITTTTTTTTNTSTKQALVLITFRL